jgi:hypothetical protein
MFIRWFGFRWFGCRDAQENKKANQHNDKGLPAKDHKDEFKDNLIKIPETLIDFPLFCPH